MPEDGECPRRRRRRRRHQRCGGDDAADCRRWLCWRQHEQVTKRFLVTCQFPLLPCFASSAGVSSQRGSIALLVQKQVALWRNGFVRPRLWLVVPSFFSSPVAIHATTTTTDRQTAAAFNRQTDNCNHVQHLQDRQL